MILPFSYKFNKQAYSQIKSSDAKCWQTLDFKGLIFGRNLYVHITDDRFFCQHTNSRELILLPSNGCSVSPVGPRTKIKLAFCIISLVTQNAHFRAIFFFHLFKNKLLVTSSKPNIDIFDQLKCKRFLTHLDTCPSYQSFHCRFSQVQSNLTRSKEATRHSGKRLFTLDSKLRLNQLVPLDFRFIFL